MKRLSLGFGLLLATSAVACDSGDEEGDVCEGGAPTCAVPWHCDPGYTCDEEGCCVEFGCTPDSCGAGEFCDVDFECKTIEEKCMLAAQGCECHILSTAGQLRPTDDVQPTDPAWITMAPGATVGLEAVLAEKGGNPLPGAVFSWGINEGSDGNQFSLSGADLTALDAAAGGATVTASAGSSASCTAKVDNLGTAPTDSNVRFFVYDGRTGAPVDGTSATVEIVVDTNGDGVDEGWAAPRGEINDNSGVAITDNLDNIGFNTSQPYDVTVFAAGYNYLTVTGLTIDAAGKDIALPLAARPANKDDKLVGGFSGRMAFETYERIVLGGSEKMIKVGIVSGSFPLEALLNFDLDLLIGEMPSAGTCDANPTAPGCYAVGLPPLVEEEVRPLPGGLVLNFAGKWLKEPFDVVATPGRRYAWALGGEVEIADIAGLAGLLFCNCNATQDVCDADCPCDTDCGIDFGALFNDLIPLFSGFGSAVQGNVGLQGVPMTVWENYLGVREDPNGYFPKLNGTDLDTLKLREPLHTFTDFEVPDLPQDPDEAAGVALEGMIVLSGIDATGFGFVPLGLGAGLDCTEGDCLDRGANPEGFDGRVNGGLMCFHDPDPALDRCPPGAPISELPDGHLGMFHAKPHGGLEGQQPLTIAIALPISSLTSGPSSDIRATGFVLRETPSIGSSTQIKSKTYPAFPAQPDSAVGRLYTVGPTAGIDVHWVTLATDEVDGITTRWNIFFDNPAATKTFHAPALPAGFVGDPAAPAADGNVNATHVAFRLTSSATVADLAANNGSTLADVASRTDGFSVQSRDICAESCP